MPAFDSNVTNSLIHLYRGELGRMVSYRVRLDTTTNWSVVTTAGITTLALGNPAIPHIVFLFAMFLVLFFLQLEARRFRVYELSRQRVRMLERCFYEEMLGEGSMDARDFAWRKQLITGLAEPRLPLGRLQAIGWRLRRNYLWLYGAMLLAWGFKIEQTSGGSLTPYEFITHASIGLLPGWATLTLVLSFYMILIVLAVWASMAYKIEQD